MYNCRIQYSGDFHFLSKQITVRNQRCRNPRTLNRQSPPSLGYLLEDMTTRRDSARRHRIDVLINGVTCSFAKFESRPDGADAYAAFEGKRIA